MNRRGFLGSLMALVVAPKAPQLFHKDLVALRSAPPAFIGYNWVQPVQFKSGEILTITTGTSCYQPRTYVLGDPATVYVKAEVR